MRFLKCFCRLSMVQLQVELQLHLSRVDRTYVIHVCQKMSRT